ncbi:MAG: type IV pili methyl-accepting chemotaxis transducer N-terminal domain-containing protein [Marinicellaceae bacterium]
MAENKITNKSKYQSLIIFISLFVIIIVGVLAINYYVSTQFSKDATEINLAGRQRMLTQKTTKAIQHLIQAQSSNQDVSQSFEELKSAFDLFDTTLNAFSNGGNTTDANGNTVILDKVDIVGSINAVNSATLVWNDLETSIRKLTDADINILIETAQAIDAATTNNNKLLDKMDQLTLSLQDKNFAGVYINLAGKQRMLSQRITKTLFEIVNAQSNNTDTSRLTEQLLLDKDQFNNTLNLFLKGGQSTANSFSTNIQAIDDPDVLDIINQGLDFWEPINVSISKLLNSDTSTYNLLASANSLAQKENLNLLSLMNDLTVSLEQDSTERSNLLRYFQVFGILLAFVMFGIIVLFFLKQLRKSDVELDKAKNETDRILDTVKDGLFLMDRDHVIGTQHSDSLVKVINIEKPAGKNFLSILRKIVPEKTLQTVKDYLDLLYGDRVNEELVIDLNPLDNVEVYFDSEELDKDIGHLGFQFKRVIVDGSVSHLLVQIENITEQVKLEKELALSKEKAKAQFDLMLEVLHVDPEMLGNFLTETEGSLKDINQILQERTSSGKGNRDKLTAIFRHIHRIKGDASGLELEGFEQKAHEFEDLIEELKNQRDLSGKDFLPLAIILDEFMGQIESLRLLISKLSELQGSVGSESIKQNDDGSKNLSNRLNMLTQSLATKNSKKVFMNVFNEHLIPAEYQKNIQDILTQLIRNSIVHGIESPENRFSNDKNNEGLINVKFSTDQNDNSIIMDYTDDGKGLITEDILQSAINKGLVNEEESLQLSKKQIHALIFKTGFSSKDNVNIDAGRGVGMDVVLNLIMKMGGKYGLRSIDNKQFKFVMKLPHINNSTGE